MKSPDEFYQEITTDPGAAQYVDFGFPAKDAKFIIDGSNDVYAASSIVENGSDTYVTATTSSPKYKSGEEHTLPVPSCGFRKGISFLGITGGSAVRVYAYR